MSQVQDVARVVLADVAADAGHVLCSQWVSTRYVEMVTKVRYRHLRKVGEVLQPRTITDGTITVEQGSRIVVPDATALAAWQAVPQDGLIGRVIRMQDATWYTIEQFVAGAITLAVGYTGTDATGIGYTLAAPYVQLAPDARWLGTFVHVRLFKPLTVVPLDTLDFTSPARQYAQGVPETVAEIGVSVSDRRIVEIYPYPAQDEVIRYVYWSLPLQLGFDTEIPRVIPDYTLREGALIDAMRFKAGQAATAGKMEEAAYWRNEYRMQETKWYTKILPDAARSDRGVDDITLIISGFGTRYNRPLIRTAHDQVYNQWWS